MDTNAISFDELMSLLFIEQERQNREFNETIQNVSVFQNNETAKVLEEYATQNHDPYPTYSHA